MQIGLLCLLFQTIFATVMAEDLNIDKSQGKLEKYRQLRPQIEALITGESDPLANASNLCAALHEAFDFLWTGIYRVVDGELVLGPFQGPVGCTRIKKGKGVCGTAWEENRTIVVEDVDSFPGHIACSSMSKSEIVLPIRNASGDVTGVLDIDSDSLKAFDQSDAHELEKIIALIEPFEGL
jgi:GAF domain-containing protein